MSHCFVAWGTELWQAESAWRQLAASWQEAMASGFFQREIWLVSWQSLETYMDLYGTSCFFTGMLIVFSGKIGQLTEHVESSMNLIGNSTVSCKKSSEVIVDVIKDIMMDGKWLDITKLTLMAGLKNMMPLELMVLTESIYAYLWWWMDLYLPIEHGDFL